jgi:hypothetical protein
MRRSYLLFSIAILLTNSICAQSTPALIKFIPKFGNSVLVPAKKYFSTANKDSISIETLRFYISDVILLKNGKVVHRSKNNFYLLDLEKKLQISLATKNVSFDVVQFTVGIDSLTNVSGAMGGDLDPVNGMYWAWQSGYINFKLEGTSKICATRNNVFQFHIGGYLRPYAAIQTVSLAVKNSAKTEIIVDIEKFLNAVDLKTINEIMSPGEKAVTLAKLYQTIFSIQE